MKKLVLIGGVALAILVAILAAVEFSRQPRRDSTAATIAAAPAAVPPAPSPAAMAAAQPEAASAAPAPSPAPNGGPGAGGSDIATAAAPAATSQGPAMSPSPQAPAEPEIAALPPALPSTTTAEDAAAGDEIALRFDAIRVNPDGQLTIAGRGPPQGRIILLDGDTEIGTVEADASGAWVFVSDAPIAAGDHQLSLRVAGAGPAAASPEVATVVVPQRGRDVAGRVTTGGPGASPLVVLTPRAGEASTVLQAPTAGAASAPAAPGTAPASGLSIDVIDYGDAGAVIVSGRAAAGAAIRLYLNDRPIGEGRADGRGVFRIRAEAEIAPGVYRLRADQLDAAGSVTARAETPFLRAAPAEIAVAEGRVVVQPGNSLWRIARRAYGQGVHYTVIYQANEEQIRDPDLIYPGQIFALPPSSTAARG